MPLTDRKCPYKSQLPALVSLVQERGDNGTKDLVAMGGVAGLAAGLGSDLKNGPSDNEDDLKERRFWFGANALEAKDAKGFWELAWEAVQDPTLIILIAAGALATTLEMIFNEKHRDTAWIEGFAIFMTVTAVVLVTAYTDLQKEKQFRDLQAQNDKQNKCTLYRGGKKVEEIPFEDVVVGDIMQIGEGLVLPADGIMIDGVDLEADEAALTGEPEPIRKSPDTAPFILSGTSISRGQGTMIVTGVGLFSESGIIQSLVTGVGMEEKERLLNLYKNKMATVEGAGDAAAKRQENMDDEASEAQTDRVQKSEGKKTSVLTAKLDKLAIQIGWLALAAGILCFVGLCIRLVIVAHIEPRCTSDCPEDYSTADDETATGPCKWLKKNGTDDDYKCFDHTNGDSCDGTKLPTDLWDFKGECATAWDNQSDWLAIVKFFIVGVTVLVVAIPEGLPLAVTISLAYSVKKMMSEDKNLVRVLASCETMGNASTICSDKTGTLTMNRMTVVNTYMGDKVYDVKGNAASLLTIPESIRQLFAEGAAVNSMDNTRYHVDANKNYVETGFEADESGAPIQFGNKTECGIIEFGDKLGLKKYHEYRSEKNEANGGMAKQFNFDHIKKRMTTVVKSNGGLRVYCKGASEIVLELCTSIVAPDGSVQEMTPERKANMETQIKGFADQALRTLILTYKDVAADTSLNEDDALCSGLTLIGLVGIQDPERPEVPEAVRQCEAAGVTVRMVTGDNKDTGRAIAVNVGIIPANAPAEYVMTGPEFRARILDQDGEIDYNEFSKIWPNLRVIARCSPTDKYNMVKGLIHFGQVVAVTGDGTNDAPALSMADVGFAMGSGTLVAQKASDIVIMNDNFASIVKAISWGRNVYDCISKFLVFQLTVNVVAVVFTFVSSIAVGASPFTATQMLWVNVIMDTLAALALATEPPVPALLERKPYARDAPLLSKQMAKQIIGHSVYQLVVCFLILYVPEMLPGDVDDDKLKSPASSVAGQHFTILFNTFVWMQLFNEVNARRIDGNPNIFEGLLNNPKYLGVMVLQIIGQIFIVQVFPLASEKAFMTTPLSAEQWLFCMAFGLGTWPWNLFLNVFVPASIVPDAIIRLFKIDLGLDEINEAVSAPAKNDVEANAGLAVPSTPNARARSSSNASLSRGHATKALGSSQTLGGSTENVASGLQMTPSLLSGSRGMRGWGRLRTQLQVVSAFQTLASTSNRMKERVNRMRLPTDDEPDASIRPARALWQASLNRVKLQLSVVDAMKSFKAESAPTTIPEEPAPGPDVGLIDGIKRITEV